MPQQPANASEAERAKLDELWAAEQNVLGRLKRFVGAGHVGKAKQAVAEAERAERALEAERDKLARAGGTLDKKGRARLKALPAELEVAAHACAAAHTSLGKVLAAKQEIVDERDEVKARRHALRVNIHQRIHPRQGEAGE